MRVCPLANASCAKIMNVIIFFFKQKTAYEICQRNPIQMVRRSAKRKKIPVVLSPGEVRKLLPVLALRERTLVLLDYGTGLRMSELFALKWSDVDFHRNEISVTRS